MLVQMCLRDAFLPSITWITLVFFVQALESVRNHLYKRARADKEYAEQLLRINQSSRKAAEFSDHSSSIVQVCIYL